MKKTFFQKTYNLISYLLFFGLISFILSFAFNLLVKLFGDFDIPFFDSAIITIQDKLSLLGNYTSQISIILFLVAVSLLIIELSQRIINDSILNYFKSVYQTRAVTQTIIFLHQIGKETSSGSRQQEDKERAVLGSQRESQKHCPFKLSNLAM